jgi:hypothetical protein
VRIRPTAEHAPDYLWRGRRKRPPEGPTVGRSLEQAAELIDPARQVKPVSRGRIIELREPR